MANPLYGQNKADSNINALASAISASATWNAGSIADGNEEALEITAAGAALGDFVLCSLDVDVADLSLSGAVTAAGVVTLVLGNNTGGAIDLASTTANVLVIQKQ